MKTVICFIVAICFAALCSPKKDPGSSKETSYVPAVSQSPLKTIVDYYLQSGFELRDSASGDLNRDSLSDIILLLDKKKSTPQTAIDSIGSRRLVILCGTGDGLYKQAAVNDNVALCKTCGDTMSDPYLRTVIKKGYFSLEHQGRYLIKWNRVTTFKYIDSVRNWVLNQDGIISEKNGAKFKVIKTGKDFGSIPFGRFTIYNFDEYIKKIASGNIFPMSFNTSKSYMHWQMVKGGIWDVLNYSTGRATKGYIEFFKSNGDYIDNPNEDLSLIYDIYTNLKVPDSSYGLAIRNIPSFDPAKVRKAGFDSTSDTYSLGSDTLRFSGSPEYDPGTSGYFLKIIRNKKTSKIKVHGESFTVDFCGDLNGDGYLDFIASENSSYSDNTVLNLSKIGENKEVEFTEAGLASFSD